MSLTGIAKNFVPLALRRRMLPVAKFVYRDDLKKLATLYGTDKWPLVHAALDRKSVV